MQELMLVELEKTRTCASPTQVDEDEHFKHWTRINIRANPYALSLTAVVDNTGRKICSFGHERALCRTKLAYICLSFWLLRLVPPFLPSFFLHATALTITACLLQVRHRLFMANARDDPTRNDNPHKPCETNGQFFPNMPHLFGEFLNLGVSNLAVCNFCALLHSFSCFCIRPRLERLRVRISDLCHVLNRNTSEFELSVLVLALFYSLPAFKWHLCPI